MKRKNGQTLAQCLFLLPCAAFCLAFNKKAFWIPCLKKLSSSWLKACAPCSFPPGYGTQDNWLGRRPLFNRHRCKKIQNPIRNMDLKSSTQNGLKIPINSTFLEGFENPNQFQIQFLIPKVWGVMSPPIEGWISPGWNGACQRVPVQPLPLNNNEKHMSRPSLHFLFPFIMGRSLFIYW